MEEEVDILEHGRVTTQVRRRRVVRIRRRPSMRRIENRDQLRISEREGEREIGEDMREEIRELLAERNGEHQEIVMRFFDVYNERGMDAFRDNFDLLVVNGNIALLHEMKTLSGANERDQIMKGIGQLFYYENLDIPELDMPEISENPLIRVVKALVFQKQLSNPLHVEFIKNLGIHVFWLNEGGGIEGETESMTFLENFLGL